MVMESVKVRGTPTARDTKLLMLTPINMPRAYRRGGVAVIALNNLISQLQINLKKNQIAIYPLQLPDIESRANHGFFL